MQHPRIVALLATRVSLIACSIALAGPPRRPNIVFIMTDDHACRAVSAYGSDITSTPNIDRIAAEGIRFDRCYVTNSICGPSRACILTGKYSHKNGYYVNDEQFDNGQTTFPALLQQAGYQTALIGKWHLGRGNVPTGFDYWHILEHQGYYYQPKFVGPLGERQHVGYVTDLLTRYTLQWLENGRDPDRPFLLMMHHKAPHRPWDPSLDHLKDDQDVALPEPSTLFDDYANRASAARRAQMRIADDLSVNGPDLKAWDGDETNGAREWFYGKMTQAQLLAWKSAFRSRNQAFYQSDLSGKELTRWKYQRFLQDYLDCVASVDESIGQVLDFLEQNDLVENTLVIYCSDQGFFLGEHGWFDKRFMYEPSLRTPLVARWPAVISPGRIDGHIVSNVDFAETILDVAGVAIPEDMQGRSLLPLFQEDAVQPWRKSFYYHYYEGLEGGHGVSRHEGVTNGRDKLIHYYEIDEWELFDLENDPHEMRSVYGNPKYELRQAAMMAELEKLRRELDVPSLYARR